MTLGSAMMETSGAGEILFGVDQHEGGRSATAYVRRVWLQGSHHHLRHKVQQDGYGTRINLRGPPCMRGECGQD